MNVVTAERSTTSAPGKGHTLALLLRRIVVRCYENDSLNAAAQVSFYFVLSMFPFFLVVAALLGWAPTSGGWQTFAKWLSAYFPARTQDTLLVIMLGLARGYRGFFSFGLALAVWSASTGFMSLMEALTRGFSLRETRHYFKRRLIALAATFLAACLLIAWFGIWTAGRTLIARVLGKLNYTPQSDALGNLLRWFVTLLMFGAAVYLINHFLPARPQQRHKLTPGTILSVLCLSVITGAFNLYMKHTSEISQVYGTLTGFIVMMLWIYLASFSLILGAEADTALHEFNGRATRASGTPTPPYGDR
ncbi:MAG TPA: YihY/virulence factor BrkB family protein [Candidatus Eisenbacteria bacterium]|nr:YihY/virulence factor BrkB family protein [Candidatus Eisenbacteria bacterium]